MADLKNQLAKNIKYLRTAFGESQFDLALAIGLESPNTISNYEKGIRSPKLGIRRKIATHYRITEDELIHSCFSEFSIPTSKLDNEKKMMEMTMVMFPVLYSKKAMKDILFMKGYSAHRRAIDAMKERREINDSDVDTCSDAYSESYDVFKTPESLANLLWWLIITELNVKNPWIIEGDKALKDKSFNNKDFYKKFYLKDCTVSEKKELLEGIEQNEIKDIEKAISELLKELKKHIELSEVADYYMSLRYIVGCVNNNLTEEMNKAVGLEMMMAFKRLGNKYAKKFIILVKNYLK